MGCDGLTAEGWLYDNQLALGICVSDVKMPVRLPKVRVIWVCVLGLFLCLRSGWAGVELSVIEACHGILVFGLLCG